MKGQFGWQRSTSISHQHHTTSLQSTTLHQTATRRSNLRRHSFLHCRPQHSTTSTIQSTRNWYHASKPSPLIKSTAQSAKHHQRRLQDQTKSPTKSSKNHTTLYSTIWILHALVQASINTAHFPAIFKTTTTVVLWKPAKLDYTKPNTYRPIALENTMRKIIL